eukprot:GILI01020872.1.p2 GENE.GILI01020872.1~~GILI01020872.1.p2  ORF type:complete len:103 (+),score=9.91 GILI01020872.1:31-339(+)
MLTNNYNNRPTKVKPLLAARKTNKKLSLNTVNLSFLIVRTPPRHSRCEGRYALKTFASILMFESDALRQRANCGIRQRQQFDDALPFIAKSPHFDVGINCQL